MTAQNNGQSHWLSGNEDTDRNTQIDLAARRSLERFQLLTKILVDLKDEQRLTALQECIHQMFRQASECLETGKTMVIRESDTTDPNWN